jgi:hypothetical protein
LAWALGAEGNAEGDSCQTQFSGSGHLADATVRQRFADQGQDIPPPEQQTPETLAAQQKAEIEKWWPILKAANIKRE